MRAFVLALALACGCATSSRPARFDGRLDARPPPANLPPPRPAPGQGRHALELGGARDGLVYVPKNWSREKAAPLLVLLHGAGGSSERVLQHVEALADELNLLVLAPDSRAITWDDALDNLGPDVDFLDRALGWVFERYRIDATHLALAGFSDGATEAMTLGLTNGLVFTHLLAFSPAGAAPPTRSGWPRIYLCHGTADRIIPIDRSSRVLAPRLQHAGYDVRYVEFDGPHTVPPDLLRAGLQWFLEK
jgi:phospholipase/carboxylesterase